MTSEEAGFWVGLALAVVGIIFGAIGASCDDSKSRDAKAFVGPMMTLACACLGMAAISWIKAFISWVT